MRLNEISTTKFTILCGVLLLVSFGLSYFYFNSEIFFATSASVKTSLLNRVNHKEIALVFIGCSECPSAENKELPSLVKGLIAKSREEAISKGYAFTSIGISNEKNVQIGLEHLFRISDFDEISLGNNMANTALQKYVWDKFDGPLSGAVPQAILTKRIYDVSLDNNEKIVYSSINSESIIVRKVGVKEIRELLNSATLVNSL